MTSFANHGETMLHHVFACLGQRPRLHIASTFMALLLTMIAIPPALAEVTPSVTFAYWGDPAEAEAI